MKPRRPWVRSSPPKRPKTPPRCAYDLETTLIPSVDELRAHEMPAYREQVKPRCISWCDENGPGIAQLRNDKELSDWLCANFFTTARNGTEFIGWNSNRFDVHIVMRALRAHAPHLGMKICAASQGIRLVFVYDVTAPDEIKWSLLDGKAMTGVTKPLAEFAAKFCPTYPKLDIGLKQKVAFDWNNDAHRRYALRDAEIVYYGIAKANAIALAAFGRPLRATIGAFAIRVFGDHLPKDVKIWAPFSQFQHDVIMTCVRRGGMVYGSRFDDLVWHYDINQAYAACMREEDLPAGSLHKTKSFDDDMPGFYLAYVFHRQEQIVPFTCCDATSFPERDVVHTRGEGILTWITSREVVSLRRVGWIVNVRYGYVYSQKFRMTVLVDKLEALRVDPTHGGPTSAVGEMMKAVGNNAFGKTMEVIPLQETVYSHVRPPGEGWMLSPWHMDDNDAWWRTFLDEGREDDLKPYHQPQIGAFITAGVRCKVFETANLEPDAFVACDTDSVMFSCNMHERLSISTSTYGAWKIEAEASRYIVIGKKVYMAVDHAKIRCKGLRTDELTLADMERWHATGIGPTQEIVALVAFAHQEREGTMYRPMTRRGTDPRKHKVPGWDTG